jgi:hypothetical protein
MTLAIIAVVVLLLVAFAAAGGAFDRVRPGRTRRVLVEPAATRERIVERPVERVVERDRIVGD